MIKVEKIDVWGFEHAIRGMRNPMNSWNLSDTTDDVIGERDAALMKKLTVSGPEHRKFLRQIMISMDIIAPLYWWKEFDTYKIGTVVDSCSTMHKIAAKEFTLDDFSYEHLFNYGDKDYCDDLMRYEPEENCNYSTTPCDILSDVVEILNWAREKYLKIKDKKYWWQMIQLLPSSYNQRRTVTMNYENAVSMIKQRTGHKLDEWREFVKILRKLPNMDIILEALKL